MHILSTEVETVQRSKTGVHIDGNKDCLHAENISALTKSSDMFKTDFFWPNSYSQ